MTPENIGKTLRTLRLSQGHSLRQLADKAECSASFLSQIELGTTSPSLSSMIRICDALNMNIREFFDAHERRREVVVLLETAAGSTVQDWDTARLRYVLPGNEQANQSYLLLELDPGGNTALRAATRTMKELAVVLSGGPVAFDLGNQTHTLRATQSIYFDLLTPHRWRNPGTEPAKILLANPSFTIVNDLPDAEKES